MPLVELRCPIAKRKNLKSYYPPSGFETKILFSSRDTDSELKYDPTLVHGMFVQCEYQDRNEDLPGNENYER